MAGNFTKCPIIIECKCGCGKTLLKYDEMKRERKYIHGHNIKHIKTKEVIEKIRLKNIGQKRTEEQKLNISKSMIGKHHTEETKRKIGLSSSNRTYSEETKQKHRDARKSQKRTHFSLIERKINSVLSVNGIKYKRFKAFKINNSWHQVDIFIEPNIVIEVDGCYWHGCRECYDNKKLFNKQIIGCVDKDIVIDNELMNQNINVLRIKEHDINIDPLRALAEVIRNSWINA